MADLSSSVDGQWDFDIGGMDLSIGVAQYWEFVCLNFSKSV
jgi:hypothetical protein